MIERVVVTGASSGIGAACVKVFQTNGAEVVGVDISSSSQADQHLQLDLRDPSCGQQILEFCSGGPIDGLVNNAGVALNKAATETSAADFDMVTAVNLRAPFLVATSLYPAIADRRGFVVNVASVHAVATSRLVAAYAASKGGLLALSRALAIEWAPHVRVNAVLPGAVETEMLREGLSRTGATLSSLSARHPAGRVGSAGEIAAAVFFLAENEFSTGTSLLVDGGATARLSTE